MSQVSPISFTGKQPRLNLKNITPKVEGELSCFEKDAKRNNVKLSIIRTINTKYLPNNYLYMIVARTPSTKCRKYGYVGTGAVITNKDDKIVLNKFKDAVDKAIKTARDGFKKEGDSKNPFILMKKFIRRFYFHYM